MTTTAEAAGAVVEPVSWIGDARGLVLEPIGGATMQQQQNVHLVLTEPGQIRGNHYHRRGTEITVVLGPARVRFRERAGGELRDVEVPAGQAMRFTFPPGLAHAFQNPGPGSMILIASHTEPHDPARPDTVREVVLGG